MRISLLSLSLLLMISCNSNTNTENAKKSNNELADTTKTMSEDMHNSENALDWEGQYKGTLPCADCSGIETRIILKGDKTYEMSRTYIDKGEPIETSGSFSWKEDGKVISLNTDEDGSQLYKVGENVLIHLDKSGNEVEGELAANYRLNKALADSDVENITWELVELAGQKVDQADKQSKSYFILNSAEGRISGNLGCNNFFGSYTLENVQRISFDKMGATRKMCADMSVDDKLNAVFNTIDNYSIQDGRLTLNKGKRAPLAVFTAVKQ